MEECNICLTKIKKRNNNRHDRSKKHKYFLSNPVIDNYVIKNDEIDKIKDIFRSYYDEHKKKFNQFRIYFIWKKNDVIINKISVPCTITFLQSHLFQPIMEERPFYVKVTLNEFQIMIDRGCVYNIVTDEIKIVLISKLKDVTISHYVKQPRSMLCRKLEKNSIEEDDPPPDYSDFDYNFLPEFFRHLNKYFDFLCIIDED